MIRLGLGLALFVLAHMLRRVAPAVRRDLDKALGERLAKGLLALVMLAGVVLMVKGYRAAAVIPVYTPLPLMGWVTNALMLVALFAAGIGPAGGRLSARFRHPMLWSVVIWAVAHLLVNGDLASILLFGGLGLWALVQIHLINRHEGPWERPMPGNAIQDAKLLLAVLFLYVVIALVHWLMDRNPFLGTYT